VTLQDFHRDWLTPAEAAAILGLHMKVIERACRRGVIAAERVGGRWHIPRAALLQALDPAVTPAVRDELQETTVRGTPRKRRPVIRSSRAKKTNSDLRP
jgi:excisionase family DNA binding protein